MTKKENPFLRWIVISSVSTVLGFIALTISARNPGRVIFETGIGDELKVAYLVSLGVIGAGLLWSFFRSLGDGVKVFAVVALIGGVLFLPALF
ncbi:MAG: hypothetical protein AAGJ81_06255 [Verrucomicrobiota bacterium]